MKRSARGGSANELEGPPAVQDLLSREVYALLAVGRTVAEGGHLTSTLNCVAREAANVVGARAASVLLLTRQGVMKLAGAHGLSAGYGTFLRPHTSTTIKPGYGPSGIAIRDHVPITIEDTERDPRVARWRHIAAAEGYQAMVSVPLVAGSEELGALNVYRSHRGPWPANEVALLSIFADHAASAIMIARLVERQQRQLSASRDLPLSFSAELISR
jgi:GAF domain-containing protein